MDPKRVFPANGHIINVCTSNGHLLHVSVKRTLKYCFRQLDNKVMYLSNGHRKLNFRQIMKSNEH